MHAHTHTHTRANTGTHASTHTHICQRTRHKQTFKDKHSTQATKVNKHLGWPTQSLPHTWQTPHSSPLTCLLWREANTCCHVNKHSGFTVDILLGNLMTVCLSVCCLSVSLLCVFESSDPWIRKYQMELTDTLLTLGGVWGY